MSSAIGVIQGFHLIVAQLRSEPHWLINDPDAARYGQAMTNAARHFPVKAAQKTIDVATFLMAAAVIETPRFMRSIQLARAPKAPNRGPAQVFQFHPNPPSQPPAATTPAQSPAPGSQGPPPDFAEGPPDPGGFGGDAA